MKREWLRADVLAGLTAAAVVIPKAMAYATIAGLPVQVGLYPCLVPMAAYALLSTSRVLSVSTTTTIAILTGAALAQVAPADPAGQLAALATLMLRMVVLGAIATAAVQATRLVLVATVGDPVDLDSSSAWDTATSLADVAVAATAAATMAAVVLVVGWAAVAGENVRALALDTRGWGPSIRRVALLAGAVVALAVAWGRLPGEPAQSDQLAELAAAFATAATLAVAASAMERLLIAVTARELEEAELLLRIEAASIDRPRSRSIA